MGVRLAHRAGWRRDGTGCGGRKQQIQHGRPPTLPCLSLPFHHGFLSPFLSGQKLIPLTFSAEQFSQFVVLIALAPANTCPQELTFLPKQLIKVFP